MHARKTILDEIVDTERPVTCICPESPVVCRKDSSIKDVLKIMLGKKYRKLPVLDKSGRLKGVITSVDMLNLLGGGEKYRTFRRCRESLRAKIEKFMTDRAATIEPKTSIGEAADVFRKEGRGFYPVADSGRIVSVVSEWDIVKLLKKPTGIKVYEVMSERPIVARGDYIVYDTAKMICRGGFRRLPVVENGILTGIVTPTDILNHFIRGGSKNLLHDATPLEMIMKKNVVTVSPDEDIFSAVKTMKGRRVGGMPVVEDEELLGIITERDILDVIA